MSRLADDFLGRQIRTEIAIEHCIVDLPRWVRRCLVFAFPLLAFAYFVTMLLSAIVFVGLSLFDWGHKLWSKP